MHSTLIIKISFLTSHFSFLTPLFFFPSILIKLEGDIEKGGSERWRSSHPYVIIHSYNKNTIPYFQGYGA